MLSRSYALHGIGLRLSAEADIMRALDARLQPFAVEDARAADLEMAFCTADDVERPPSGLRSVYEPSGGGDVLYDPATDRLFIGFDERLQLVCEPSGGRTRAARTRACPEDTWLLSHPLLTLPLIETLRRRGLFNIHAAGAARNGRALLIAGPSGAGKTTLSIALARAGFDFLGDDTLFLTRAGDGLQVCAFPDEVDVTASTAEFFPELASLTASPRQPGWPKWSFRVESAFGGTRIAWAAEPAAIVFPRMVDEPKSCLEPLSGQRGLLELLPNILLTHPDACQAHLRILADLTSHVPCYELAMNRDVLALPALLGELLA
jgi:hypothetical protein